LRRQQGQQRVAIRLGLDHAATEDANRGFAGGAVGFGAPSDCPCLGDKHGGNDILRCVLSPGKALERPSDGGQPPGGGRFVGDGSGASHSRLQRGDRIETGGHLHHLLDQRRRRIGSQNVRHERLSVCVAYGAHNGRDDKAVVGVTLGDRGENFAGGGIFPLAE
jgi:hypothetical protein